MGTPILGIPNKKLGLKPSKILKLVRTNSISETLGIADKQLITIYIIACLYNNVYYF